MSAIVVAVISAVAAVVAGMFALAALDRMFTSDDLPAEEESKHKRRFDTWVNVYGFEYRGRQDADPRTAVGERLGPPEPGRPRSRHGPRTARLGAALARGQVSGRSRGSGPSPLT